MFKLKIAFWSVWSVFSSLPRRFRFFLRVFVFFPLFAQDSSLKLPTLSDSEGFECISGRLSCCSSLFFCTQFIVRGWSRIFLFLNEPRKDSNPERRAYQAGLLTGRLVRRLSNKGFAPFLFTPVLSNGKRPFGAYFFTTVLRSPRIMARDQWSAPLLAFASSPRCYISPRIMARDPYATGV